MSHFNHSYALVVGINAYNGGIAPLSNAVNDARAVANLLEAKHGYKVWRLFDEDASCDRIQHALKTALPAHIQADDRLLFYFSGHGIQLSGSDGPEGYLIPQTAQLGQSQTYLSMHEVVQDLNELPCRHLLSILDCCFAGSFRWSSQHRKAIVFDSEPLYKEKYDRYVRDRAWQAITSAAYDQLAYDAFDLRNDRGQDTTNPQHSPFATALLAALSGGADMSPPATKPGQRPGDGVTTATELYQFLRDTVEPPTETHGMRQTPELCALGKHDKGEYIFETPDHPLNLPPAPALDRTTNPYKGLASFDEADRDRFFGRKAIATELHTFCAQHQLTVVLGPSGSGKSSLVKAGLLPRVRETKQEGAEWVVLSPFRPGRSPFLALNEVLSQSALPTVSPEAQTKTKAETQTEAQTETTASTLLQTQPTPSRTLSPEAALKNWFQQHPVPLLIVIDQFEELITQCSDREREQFLETMAIALEAYPDQLRIVITLRSDFESQFQSSALEPFWKAARFQVSALSRQELRQAVEKPAALRVLFFDPPEMVDRLIDEVVNMPGGLPLLSFALSELYLRYLSRQEIASKQGSAIERAITEADYSALGGVTLALIKRAETEYQRLYEEDVIYARTVQQVMLRMVDLEGGSVARRSLLVSDQQFSEPEHGRVQTVLTRFLEARLLVSGKTTDGESFVEPAHDALVTGWPRLSQWLKQKEIQETLLLIRSLASVADRWMSSHQDKASRGLLWKDDPRLPQAMQVMCGDLHRAGARDFFHWLARSVIKKLRLPRKGFWDLSNPSAWLNLKEEQFVKDSLDGKYHSRFIGYSLAALAGSGLFALATVAVLQRNLAKKAENISNVQAQSSRSIVWTSNGQATEGLALAINALQNSIQYPQARLDAERAIVAAVQNAREQNRIDGHNSSVRAVAYSADGQYIASGSTKGQYNVKIWDSKTGQLVQKIEASDSWIYALAFSPDGQQIASAGKDGIIRIWNVSTAEQVGPDLADHDGPVRSIAFSPDGQRLASGSDDKTMRIWDVKSAQSEPKAHWGAVWSVTFSNDGKQIASGSIDNRVRLWNAETGDMTGEPMAGHQGAVYSVAFNADGTILVSGSSDRTLRRWNTATRTQIGDALRGHVDRIYAVKYSPDDRYIISAGADRSIRLWDAANGIVSGQILDAHNNYIRSIDISDRQIASGGSDRSIRLWDIRSHMPTGQPLVSDHETSILSVTLSPEDNNRDNNYLASADEKGSVKLWKVSFKRQRPIDVGKHAGPVNSVAISPDNQRLVSAGSGGILRIWSMETESKIRELYELKGHSGESIHAVAFSPRGNIVVSSGGDGNLNLWNPARGEQMGTPIEAHAPGLTTVAFDPSGNYMVSGGADQKVILWDARSYRPIWTREGHSDAVRSVAFSRDGQRIASGGKDNKILIWETQTGRQMGKLAGHNNEVWSVQFSPKDRNLLASGSYDGTVRLWDAEQQQPIGPAFLGHIGNVQSVIFGPKGKHVYSVGTDLSLRIWPAYWQKWPEMACERIKYHPILEDPESIFAQDEQAAQDADAQASIDMAKQTKSACDREFWRDL